jgi:hypothetical protein
MVVLLALVLIPALARAQELLTGSALVAALKRGGYVVVLRHASSPREVLNERTAHPDNTARERQLDEADARLPVRLVKPCALIDHPAIQ